MREQNESRVGVGMFRFVISSLSRWNVDFEQWLLADRATKVMFILTYKNQGSKDPWLPIRFNTSKLSLLNGFIFTSNFYLFLHYVAFDRKTGL